jgi:N-acetylglucosaminyl-diphospho-decaprenol L-rhamnosyltransferase
VVPNQDLTAAVVVNYRSAALTVECVRSLRAAGVGSIVVVDNASGDGCARQLAASDPATLFVGLPVNRGYGAAANVGVARTSSEYVIVCNPDLLLAPGAVDELIAVLASSPQVGAVGPTILRTDGTRYPSARSFPSLLDAAGHGFIGLWGADNRWSKRYLRTDEPGAGPVDWVSGAFIALRRAAFDAVAGFDESYFMFMEDVDICRRLHLGGWGVVFEPAASVTHIEGASRATAPYRMIVAHHASLLRYSWRAGAKRDRMALPVVAGGLVVRAGLLCARTAVRKARN